MSCYKNIFQVLVVTLSFAGAAALTGCGVGSTAREAEPAATTAALGTIQGSDFGGHAPIVGAKVFVLEATLNGYGAKAKSLLSASYSNALFPTAQDSGMGVTSGLYYVLTDATGSFNISGDYSCDAGQPVYLYLAGGAPSTVAGTPSNAAIVNMAMLGVCSSSLNFSSLNFVYVNEVSSVAAAYAMAGFAKDSLHMGSSATNLVGLQNAALNAATLYNIQGNGPYSAVPVGEGHIANVTNPSNSNGSVPQATIDSLANIVAGCVDTSNTTVGTTTAALAAESPGCSGLFQATTSNGLAATPSTASSTATNLPIDTGTAMINLAHYPAGINTYPNAGVMDSTNPTTLYNLGKTNTPFIPNLSKAPTDWTVALTYKNVATPSAIAIDGSGDAYVGTYSTAGGNITELGPQGSVTATSSTTVPSLAGLGVSTGSVVWAASSSNNQLYRFSSSLGTSSTYTSPQTTKPSALAIDSAGNVYVVNNAGAYPFYISEFNSAGTVTNYAYNYQYAVANSVALTANGGLWVVASLDTNTSLFPNTGGYMGGATLPTSGGSLGSNDAVAVDYQGNAWITGKSTGNQSLARINGGFVQTPFGVNSNNNGAIGGINNPVGVAVDGNIANNSAYFNVWVANSGNNTISEVNSASQTSALSPSVGYQAGTGLVNGPSAIAVDNAGNVWVTNQGNSTVLEIIGSATPAATLAAGMPGVAP